MPDKPSKGMDRPGAKPARTPKPAPPAPTPGAKPPTDQPAKKPKQK